MNGIWIRTQNKGLYFCVGFDAPEKKTYADDKNKPYVIQGFVSCELQPWLGWYATEERALQVLDEIQQQIQNNVLRYRKEIGEEVYYQQCFVYEMPQE